MAENYLMTEEQVPGSWQPAESPMQAAPPPPQKADVPQYFSGSLPPTLQHDTSFVKTEVGGSRLPAFSLMPFGIQGNPVTNAGIQSTIIQAPAPTPPSSGSGLTSVGLVMPQEFSVTNSPLTSNGSLVVDWSPEQLGMYLGVSSVTNVPVPDEIGGNTSTTTSVTSSITPSGQNLTLYFGCVGTNITGTISSPTGGSWTNFESRNGISGGWYQNFASSSPISETASYTSSGGLNFASANALMSFSTTSAAVVTSVFGGASGSVPGVQSGSGTVSAGQALVAYAMGNCLIAGGAAKNTSMSVSDNKGNVWYQLTYQRIVTSVSGAGISAFIGVWFCPNPVAGSTTFTLNMDSTTGGSGCWRVLGITNLALSSSQIPTFRFINFSDVTGINPLAKGGTGSNLASTGGPSQFVRQNSAGANLDVIQPDWSDLAGAAGVFPAQYNGIGLVANRIAVEYGVVNNANQSSNTGVTTIYNVPTGGAGLYRVSVYLVVSRAATTSSTLPDSQLVFTDRDSSAVITANVTPPDTGNTTSTFQQTTFILNAKALTPIRYAVGQVTPYASSGATSMLYAYRAIVEYLG